MGLSQPSADRLLAARQADRQRARRVVQRHAGGRVFGRALVRELGAKQIIESWRREYNESRPHRSLEERTPSEFACQIALKGDLTAHKSSELTLEVLQKKGTAQP